MIEGLIVAVAITWAVKKAAEYASEHWQSSKTANRRSTKGQPVRHRAASAARHDAAYWAEQVRGGFPRVRHGLYMGWNAGRIAQLEGWQARAQARADHARLRARVTEAVREQRRRQEEALERIRAAATQAEPENGENETAATPEPQQPAPVPPPRQAAGPPAPDGSSTTPAEGSTMSGDTTYTQQMTELEAIRRDAEEEVGSVRRKRMLNRLDVLMSLGLDKNTLSEAAEIDDALKEQEKAAQQTLDAADAAISGLRQRHGGTKEAVDDSPADKAAEPEFYQD